MRDLLSRLESIIAEDTIEEKLTDEQREFFSDAEMDIIEEVEVGDYDLVLLYGEMYKMMTGTGYTLGLQRQGNDFTDWAVQIAKHPISSLNLGDLSKALSIAIEWSKKYGKISVGSFDAKKTQTYGRVFRRAGVSVEEKNFLGQDVLIISSKT